MAITAEHLAITVNYTWAGQKMQSKAYFRATGAAFLTADAAGVGEAFWNHVKAAWRGVVPSAVSGVFQSVFVEEIGGGLNFGEYPIPVGEQGGSRAGVTGEAMPSFLAAGVKFTVGTRLTRSGAMRVPFVNEMDCQTNTLQSAYLTVVGNLANVYANVMTLGAPVATGVLQREVIRWTKTVPPAISAVQDVNGYLVATIATTQNSRKQGRGA